MARATINVTAAVCFATPLHNSVLQAQVVEDTPSTDASVHSVVNSTAEHDLVTAGKKRHINVITFVSLHTVTLFITAWIFTLRGLKTVSDQPF